MGEPPANVMVIIGISRLFQRFTDLTTPLVIMESPVLYHSASSILEVLRDDKYKNTAGVSKLLKAYDELVEKTERERPVKNHPLIVLEGLDGCGKSTLTKKLRNKLNAELYMTPPKSLGDDMRREFDDNELLRTAYYALGNYIGAMEMKSMLQFTPVVLDRYWHSTAAYAIAQRVQDDPEFFKMPEKDDPIYIWPSDLMKPDIVILLNVSEWMRLKRHSNRTVTTKQEDLMKENMVFRQNILQAYKNMRDPSIVVANADPFVNKVLRDLQEKVQHLF